MTCQARRTHSIYTGLRCPEKIPYTWYIIYASCFHCEHLYMSRACGNLTHALRASHFVCVHLATPNWTAHVTVFSPWFTTITFISISPSYLRFLTPSTISQTSTSINIHRLPTDSPTRAVNQVPPTHRLLGTMCAGTLTILASSRG